MHDPALRDDIDELGRSSWFEGLAGSTLLVTGSTGLIGSLLVRGALAWNDACECQARRINVIAVARNERKARDVFGDSNRRDDLQIAIADVAADELAVDGPVDWISHGASMTSSADFARRPVEVAMTEIQGTRNVLELAREKSVHGMVYLSSLEVYGDIPADHGDVHETDEGVLDRFLPRNSYPAAKRMCETLCAAYATEHGTNAKIARLAQTFGAGVAHDDQRVFAQFARAAIQGEPIVMRTPGEGRRCYCYTTDAVNGLLAVLQAGEAGQAYNVANPATYCSVREMAEMVVGRFGEGGVSLTFDFPEDLAAFGFAPPSFVRLNADKLATLGWSPRYDLPQMYDKLVASMSSSRE